jgi:hypothetical protein
LKFTAEAESNKQDKLPWHYNPQDPQQLGDFHVE